MNVLVCHSTCPDVNSARTLARTLVEERLAACVQIVPGVESFYRWQNQMEQCAEILLLIKTDTRCWPVLRERLLQLHPYAVPELVAIKVHDGLPAYLDWVQAQTSGGVL